MIRQLLSHRSLGVRHWVRHIVRPRFRPEKKRPIGIKDSANDPVRVLIADDEKSVGTSLAALVDLCGHQVVEVVSSGLEAIQAYSRHRPDVVLMDYSMSKLNGATACRNILARDPAARVILVSGWSGMNDLGNSGAVAVLEKPVHLDRLYAALHAAAPPQRSD